MKCKECGTYKSKNIVELSNEPCKECIKYSQQEGFKDMREIQPREQ